MKKPRKPEWVRLPTAWIEARGLRVVRWNERGADNVAGLMLLVAIAHRMDQTTGSGRLTYDDLQDATGLIPRRLRRGPSDTLGEDWMWHAGTACAQREGFERE